MNKELKNFFDNFIFLCFKETTKNLAKTINQNFDYKYHSYFLYRLSAYNINDLAKVIKLDETQKIGIKQIKQKIKKRKKIIFLYWEKQKNQKIYFDWLDCKLQRIANLCNDVDKRRWLRFQYKSLIHTTDSNQFRFWLREHTGLLV